MWDDHETANDAWSGGAENHQPQTEGEWPARKAAAVRAYREWLPVGERTWESYEIGELATLFRPETRVTGRSRPLDFGDALAGRSDAEAALVAFRDGPWRDPGRTMMGAGQEAWLAGAFGESVRRGAKWQLLAQQVVVGSLSLSDELAGFLDQGASEAIRRRTAAGRIAARVGLPFNLDAWDGYPAARDRLLGAAQAAAASLVTLSGDSHNAWAFDLDRDGAPAGVDLAVQSVTSSGIESVTRATPPADIARAMVASNRQLRWADTSRRGYLVVELTPQRATGEWRMLDTVRERSTALAGTHRMTIRQGTNRFDGTT
jgi:alkaline phosphatase D